MKFNVNLKPKSNPNIESRSEDIIWRNKINSDLKRLSQTTYNSPIVIEQVLRNVDGGAIDGVSGITYLQALTDTDGNGFYSISSGVLPAINQLLSATRIRLSKVNEIILSYDVAFSSDGVSGFFPLTADGDYNINLYISLLYTKDDKSFVHTDPFSYKELWTKAVQLTYTLSTDTWSIANPNGDFRLKNTINKREIFDLDADILDFTVNPDQITTQQYSDLVSDSNSVIVYFGYADDEYTALSANNQAHFGDYFNINTGSGTVLLEPRLSIKLYYYGLTSSYIPAN